jgi:hypothetical protein
VLTSVSTKLSLGNLSTLPLNAIDARATIGQGNLRTACSLWNSAFTLELGGDVALDTVLTNSPIRDWPVNLSLARQLAQKIPHLTATAPTNTAYVRLPPLFRVKGTLGAPTTSFDTAAFAQWTAQSLLQGRTVGGVEVGSVVQGLNKLLGGQSSDKNPEPASAADGPTTNAPPSPVDQLLQRWNRPQPQPGLSLPRPSR